MIFRCTQSARKNTQTCRRIRAHCTFNMAVHTVDASELKYNALWKWKRSEYIIKADAFQLTVLTAPVHTATALDFAIGWAFVFFLLFSVLLYPSVSLLVRHNNIVMKVIINKLWLNGKLRYTTWLRHKQSHTHYQTIIVRLVHQHDRLLHHRFAVALQNHLVLVHWFCWCWFYAADRLVHPYIILSLSML